MSYASKTHPAAMMCYVPIIKQNTEPWITSEILETIRLRDRLRLKHVRTKKDEDYKDFCKLRNSVQKLCKKAKAEYFNTQVEQHKNDSKKLWNQFKKLGYKQNVKGSSKIVIDVDGNICHDDYVIANNFNTFFTTIASTLVEKLPANKMIYTSSSSPVKGFYNDRQPSNNKLYLKHVSESFVFKELCKLNINKSTGLDGIPARFLKDAAHIIKLPITFLINLSISEGCVPDDLKLAKVKPLFKKSNRKLTENYRPVSILSIVSKILERAVYS
jgi:hypothetical protein